jgi:hypothetical protein
MPAPDKDQLQKVIKDVVARINRYKGSAFNEQDTKASLIKPILEALGWDTSDPEQVRHEFKTNPKDNPVDYALMHIRQPRLMVEAKGLGESLDDQKWVGQMLGYAAVGGAMWCVLTNGEEYRIYNATAPVAAADKLLYKVRLTSAPIEEATRLLSLIARANLGVSVLETLWKTQHVDRKVGAALQEMFAAPDKRLVGLIRTKESGLTPKDVLNSLRRLIVRIEQPPIQYPSDRQKMVANPALAVRSSPKAKKPKTTSAKKTPRVFGVELVQLISAGMLPSPLRLFRNYKGKLLEATLLADGQVQFGGTTYDTCSRAAEVARETITGRRMNTNGWAFWQLDSGGTVKTLEEVRANFLSPS